MEEIPFWGWNVGRKSETRGKKSRLRNNFSFGGRHVRLEPIELIKFPARTLSRHKKLSHLPFRTQ